MNFGYFMIIAFFVISTLVAFLTYVVVKIYPSLQSKLRALPWSFVFIGVLIVSGVYVFWVILEITYIIDKIPFTHLIEQIPIEFNDLFIEYKLYFYLLFWLVSLLLCAWVVYFLLYRFYQKISFSYKPRRLYENWILVNVIYLLKWNNVITFSLTTFIALVNLYSPLMNTRSITDALAMEETNSVFIINIITFTLIITVLSFMNNYYLNKITNEIDIKNTMCYLETKLRSNDNITSRRLQKEMTLKFNTSNADLEKRLHSKINDSNSEISTKLYSQLKRELKNDLLFEMKKKGYSSNKIWTLFKFILLKKR